MCCSYTNNNAPISSQFCTCYDSSAAMACANLWSDCIITLKIRAKIFLQNFRYGLVNCLWNVSLSSANERPIYRTLNCQSWPLSVQKSPQGVPITVNAAPNTGISLIQIDDVSKKTIKVWHYLFSLILSMIFILKIAAKAQILYLFTLSVKLCEFMTFKVISNPTVHSKACQASKKEKKITARFPSPSTSNTENIIMSWSHNEVPQQLCIILNFNIGNIQLNLNHFLSRKNIERCHLQDGGLFQSLICWSS